MLEFWDKLLVKKSIQNPQEEENKFLLDEACNFNLPYTQHDIQRIGENFLKQEFPDENFMFNQPLVWKLQEGLNMFGFPFNPLYYRVYKNGAVYPELISNY